MSDLPIPELSRAILIGASSFTGLPDLPAVNKNLADLASALTDPATGILLRDRCTTLLSPDSTAMFMTRLRAVTRQTEDFLLVYYAGHGIRDQLREDRLYLAVRETDPDGPDGTAVLFASFRDAIQDSPARAKVLILDCCYSGMAVGAMSTGAIDVRDVAVGGTAVITSSPPNKISLSPPGDRHTAFTGELITLLNRGLSISGEPLTVLTAYRALQVALAKRQLPHPKLKVTDTSSDILLRRTPPPPPPTPVERIDVTPTRLPGRAPLPTPRLQPLIDWRQSKSPAPALTPTPVPDQMTERPPSLVGATAMFLAARCGWLLLWTGFIFLLSCGIGGIAGTLFDSSVNSSTDIIFGLSTLVPALFIGAVLWVHYQRQRAMGQPLPRLENVNPLLASKLATPITMVLTILLACLLGLMVVTFFVTFTSAPGNPVMSQVTAHVMMALLMGLGAAACAYRLYHHLSCPKSTLNGQMRRFQAWCNRHLDRILPIVAQGATEPTVGTAGTATEKQTAQQVQRVPGKGTAAIRRGFWIIGGGVILVVLGYLLFVNILITLGVLLVVVGIIMQLVGAVGRRRHHCDPPR